MNRQICTIFLVITNVLASFCQISENFESESLSQFWQGDRSSFRISMNKELQLNATEAGQASLYAPFILEEEMSWNLSFEMDFNPSNNNQLRIYLYRNDPIGDTSEALFLEIGQNGSQDALHLYQLIDQEEVLIASGSMGLFAENPSAELIVKITSDNICAISIVSPTLGCIADDILVAVAPMDIGASMYFGWTCTYSTTRKDKFFFDDIHVRPYEEDLTPPILETVKYDDGIFALDFDEPIISDGDIMVSPNLDLAIAYSKQGMIISGDFQENQTYTLTLENISDIAGNLLDTSVSYFVARAPQLGDLIINEILFNPIGSGVDYVEIVNTSDVPLSLGGVTIANVNKDQAFAISQGQIAPNAILVLTNNKRNVIGNYPNHNEANIIEQSIPTWNNDEDNVTILLKGLVIDEFDYDENMHLAFLDEEDGVSLERISIDQPTSDEDNWTSAAASSGYGTPGLPNSAAIFLGQSNQLELESKIISPNGDGDRDELEVTYGLDAPGYIATASIYTDSGHLVDYVFRNQSLSTSGSIKWNPVTSTNNAVSTGLYILQIELFNLQGSTLIKKFSFGIADHIR